MTSLAQRTWSAFSAEDRAERRALGGITLKMYDEDEVPLDHDANLFFRLDRFGEVKSLLRRGMPTARRVLGEGHALTLRICLSYGRVLYTDPDATLDYVREAVTTLEDVERIARRVLGSAHPLTKRIVCTLRNARDTLRARETPPGS